MVASYFKVLPRKLSSMVSLHKCFILHTSITRISCFPHPGDLQVVREGISHVFPSDQSLCFTVTPFLWGDSCAKNFPQLVTSNFSNLTVVVLRAGDVSLDHSM